uniref:Cell division control protein 45 n=1 Tax=Kalanchoe fedtschenkoi TaxID=63787 RepID=A0A7N0VE76_KALFE
MVREQRVEYFYSRLRESASASSSSPLLIFPSTSDVDSLCALKILFHVLKTDSVRYACYPVSSFQEIHKYAGPDLSSSSSDCPVSILLINWGCHRDLRKILDLGPAARVFVVDITGRFINDRVVVLYTLDDEQQADLAYDFDVSALANASDLNSDDDGMSEDRSDDESDSDGEEEEAGDGRRRKRRKVDSDGGPNEEDPVKVFRKLKKDYYHMGYIPWETLRLLHQFVHERLTNERHLAGVMELEHHINTSGNLDTVTSVTLKDGTKVRAPDALRISYEDEPRLKLLQEWNLFDSMLCSSYIATKMKTWTENGIKKLKLLLARMGFALVDCQQKFQYMNVGVKRKMNLIDSCLIMMAKVSAADVVYGVTALLESLVKSDDSCASKQFGVAYDALSLKNLDKLKTGMNNAIQIQKAILRQGSSAITRSGSIRSGRKFRWVKLEDSVDARLLGYPQALTKFGYFVMDALREKSARIEPLLCACLSQDVNKMLIVGICGKPRLGAVQGNAFGIAFRSAAEEIGAEYFHELFESSWIVLDTVSVNSFMIKLTENL